MKNFLSAFLVGLLILAPVSEAKGPGHSVIERGKSGGSVSDTVYGAGWNADTTTAPSKNAVYDKIEAIVVGDPVFFDDAATAGNVTYVGCSDSIASAITAATAGDTLQLGSCTYSPGAALAINKALTIKGSGVGQTIITAFEGLFTVTADNVHLQDFTIYYSGSGAISELVSFDCSATTVCTNQSLTGVNINITTSGNTPGRIQFYDAGGIVSDVHYTAQFSYGGSGQVYGGVFKRSYSTAEADTTLRVYNSSFRSTNTNSAHSGQHRAGMNWNNGGDESAASHYFYSYNSDYIVINSAASDTADMEAVQHQGNRIYGYFYGGVIDGTSWATPGVSATLVDLRCHDGAVCNFYGTTFGRALDEGDTGGGVTKIWGYMYTNGVLGDTPTQAPAHLNAIPALQLTGAKGGDKPGTGSTTGLVGGGVSLTGGAGGAATAATVTGTAGAGAAFTLATGAGGAQTTATSTTNVGGAGGAFTLYAGDGGVGNSAATTNTGGAGGKIYIYPGLGGVGTTTSGSNGDLILGRTAAGVERGNVGINTLTPVSKLDIADASGSAGPTLTLKNTDTTISSSDVMGVLDFYGDDANLTTQKVYGRIHAVANGTTTTDQATGTILMSVVLASASSPTELFRLSNTGLTINEQSQDALVPLRVEGNTDANLIYVDGATNSVQIGSSTATAGKFIVAPPSSQTIAATNTITADGCGAIKRITAAGAVTTSTTDTFTAPAAGNTGCIMTVVNVGANNITLDNNANFKSAGAADVVMTPDDVVIVASDGTDWYQVSALEAN